jgi:riboflavin kinase/FMN adenylyltransferase
MELIRGIHNLKPHHRGCVGTIGAFDGVHLGHQTLLRKLREEGEKLGLPAVVICFEPLPREYFAPVEAPARLMSFREKLHALAEMGVERVLRINFNERFCALSAQAFVDAVIVRGLGMQYVVVGDDLRYGAGRKGDIRSMRRAGEAHGFAVVDTPSVKVAGERVSSSRIRQELENADFELAGRLLGRPFSMSGKVCYGRQLGRTLGVPTANVELHRIKAPIAGVYAVEVAGINGRLYHGVANVGVRPTVGDRHKAILEVHMFDFDGDIYGRRITVLFRHKIRDERKFDSLEALEKNIRADIEASRHWFGIA